MMRFVLLTAFVLSGYPAFADTSKFAEGLSWVVASDRACGITLNAEAIRTLIEANVPADDLGFAQQLQSDVYLATLGLEEMTEGTKAAHCAQVARVAKSYGLID